MDKQEKIRLILSKVNKIECLSFQQGIKTVEEGDYSFDCLQVDIDSSVKGLIDLLEDIL